MAYIIMAYEAMAYIGTACIVMAYIIMAPAKALGHPQASYGCRFLRSMPTAKAEGIMGEVSTRRALRGLLRSCTGPSVMAVGMLRDINKKK